MTADLVTDALIMAIWRRQPGPELLHHSGQARQYTCEQLQILLADRGIECSMSRLGDCHDNAVTESFFSRMKKVESVAADTGRAMKHELISLITLKGFKIRKEGNQR